MCSAHFTLTLWQLPQDCIGHSTPNTDSERFIHFFSLFLNFCGIHTVETNLKKYTPGNQWLHLRQSRWKTQDSVPGNSRRRWRRAKHINTIHKKKVLVQCVVLQIVLFIIYPTRVCISRYIGVHTAICMYVDRDRLLCCSLCTTTRTVLFCCFFSQQQIPWTQVHFMSFFKVFFCCSSVLCSTIMATTRTNIHTQQCFQASKLECKMPAQAACRVHLKGMAHF